MLLLGLRLGFGLRRLEGLCCWWGTGVQSVAGAGPGGGWVGQRDGVVSGRLITGIHGVAGAGSGSCVEENLTAFCCLFVFFLFIYRKGNSIRAKTKSKKKNSTIYH